MDHYKQRHYNEYCNSDYNEVIITLKNIVYNSKNAMKLKILYDFSNFIRTSITIG